MLGVSDCIRCCVVGIEELGVFNMCSYSCCMVLLCSWVGLFCDFKVIHRSYKTCCGALSI